MATNRTALTAHLLRHSALWAVRQVMGTAAIVASVVLVLGAGTAAHSLASRFGWVLPATALGLVAWLAASAGALYALTALLRLRRDRAVGLGLLLAVVYGVLLWLMGGLPRSPTCSSSGRARPRPPSGCSRCPTAPPAAAPARSSR